MSNIKMKHDSFDVIEKSVVVSNDSISSRNLETDPFDIEIKTISISPENHESTPLTHNICSAGGSCLCSQAYAC